MESQFEWSESGKLLLTTIQNYIEKEGGNAQLLKKINQEESRERKKLYELSKKNVIRENFIVKKEIKTRGVIIENDHFKKHFNSTKLAAEFLRVNQRVINRAIQKNYRCRGWDISHSNKYYFRNIYIKMNYDNNIAPNQMDSIA